MATLPRFRTVGILSAIAVFARWAAGPVEAIGGEVVFSGGKAERTIALTFDDGPSPSTTAILDILDQHGAKGTFFLVGANVRRSPEVARDIILRGHEVGDHSERHSYALPYSAPSAIWKDYRSSAAAIEKATGLNPRFYRAPHGRPTPWMRWRLREGGLSIIGWDASPRDWVPMPDKVLERKVAASAHPGSIILLHDGMDLMSNPDRSTLVCALPGIVEDLWNRGYRLVTVSELLKKEPYFASAGESKKDPA